jgi:hypothetical protein
MTKEKSFGKIENIVLGGGGYQDAMFGVSVTLSFGGMGSQVFKGTWANHPGERAQYSVEDLAKEHAETYAWLRQLMKDAKVDDFNKLKGKPIEVISENMAVKSWRILTEVL